MFFKFLQLLLLSCVVIACEVEKPKDGCAAREGMNIGAYYYAWYTPAKWQEPYTNHPTRGTYNSMDPAIIRAHVKDARRAGIDFFIVSWIPGLGPDIDPLLNVLDEEKFGYALQYESNMALELETGGGMNFNQPSRLTHQRMGDLFLSHMGKFMREIATRPSYFRFEDRPVLILYLARNYYESNEDIAHFASWAKHSHERPFIIGDVVYWNTPSEFDGRVDLKLFDGLTAYNMYDKNMINEMANYVPSVKDVFSKYAKYAKKNGIAFIPNFQPGYDDRALRGGTRPVIARNDGAFFADSFGMAAKQRVGAEMMFLTSFNEWFEGTDIEGSQEYQDKYLDQLCALKTDFVEKESAIGRAARKLWRRIRNVFR